jgi:flotillin
MTSLLALLILTAGGLGVTAATVKRLLAVCQPNQVLVIYGLWRGRGYRLLRGGSTLLFPLLEESVALDLSNRNIPIRVVKALTSIGIRITVEGVANLKIASHEPTVHAAVERLIGRTREEVSTMARLTLESNLRGLIATLSPEQLNGDADAFARALLQHAQDDMQQLGLELDSLLITSISDDVRYLNSLGRPQQVKLLRRSRIAEAEARAQSRMEAVEQQASTQLAQIRRDEAIARVEAQRRIQEAGTRQLALVAEAEAETAGERSRVEAELPLQVARIAAVTAQLQADVVAPAQAEYEASLAAARTGAARLRADGDAQAEALRVLMDSLLAAGPDGRQVFLMQRLQPLLALLRQAVPTLDVEQVRLISESGESPNLAGLLAQVQAATNLDLGRWLRPADPPP